MNSKPRQKKPHFPLFFTLFCLIFLFTGVQDANAYFVTYKEQYYRLYHVHYQQYPDDVMENIYWLEQAAKAEFCNPQHALAKITKPIEHEKYRYLFMMHINLKLIEQHLRLGRIWDKRQAFYYEAHLKDVYLRNLETAETCYRAALTYWDDVQDWAQKAESSSFKFMTLYGVQNWEDEKERIKLGTLNYKKTIERELARIAKVRADYEAMN